ncbi:MAG: YhcN/YlaJ family sporulation lipoprotein [Oscillospiraceae bacterium]|nr:YhcN/YlaJ family sporulation lipoprotein [Oscillospiraceae bacterium]
MKKFSKKTFKVFSLTLIALLLIAALSSCTNTYNENPPTSPSPSVSPIVINPITTPSGLPLPSGSPGIGASPNPSEQPAAPTLSNQESAALASKCDTRISQISEIEKSATVVLGDTSLSGVTFVSAYKGALTDRIAEIVSGYVKEIAPSVQASLVTNSPEVVQRIEELREKQKNGGTADELKQEFEDIKKAIQ